MDEKLCAALCGIVGREYVNLSEPMSRHTTFRIGGPADYFVLPHTAEEIRDIIEACKDAHAPWHIIGNGSNLLVGDDGVRGVVIRLYKNFNAVTLEGNTVLAQAGANNSMVARHVLEAGLSGFEFAAGIPGTIGGAVAMNAGAYGGEMKDILEEVTALDEDGGFCTLKKEELKLGYRTSVIAKKGYTVLEAKLRLTPGKKEEILARMEELREKRAAKQPLDCPSAGSTFKRPEGYFAGKLIMEAGLKGFCVGGAKVSEKHCGFVINTGGATAADVDALIKEVQQRVYESFGVCLEPEVKRLGSFRQGKRD